MDGSRGRVHSARNDGLLTQNVSWSILGVAGGLTADRTTVRVQERMGRDGAYPEGEGASLKEVRQTLREEKAENEEDEPQVEHKWNL